MTCKEQFFPVCQLFGLDVKYFHQNTSKDTQMHIQLVKMILK